MYMLDSYSWKRCKKTNHSLDILHIDIKNNIIGIIYIEHIYMLHILIQPIYSLAPFGTAAAVYEEFTGDGHACVFEGFQHEGAAVLLMVMGKIVNGI